MIVDPLEAMAQVLSRSALEEGLDLGDERQVLARVNHSFLPAEVHAHMEEALERARARHQQNQRFHDAADSVHRPARLGLWLIPIALALLVHPSRVMADDGAAPAEPGLLARLFPVVVGIVLVLFLLRVVLCTVWGAEVRRDEEELDAAGRWNGEGL